ncbi:MAG: DinB family protein [Gemmatimonadota bacterium]
MTDPTDDAPTFDLRGRSDMSETTVSDTDRAASSRAPPASPAELLFPDLDEELDATRTMLERAPGEPAGWRPHEKSMTLAVLATHLAQLPGFPIQMLEHDEVEVPEPAGQPEGVADAAERLAVFDEASGELRDLVERLTWDRAMQPWTLRIDGEVVLEGPRAALVRSAGFSHMAHHRAQLGVYLRMLDVPVPGTYGPSADEPWDGTP